MTFQRYEMTPEQHSKLLESCKPVPYIAAQCGPMVSPQERANEAWRQLGETLGFDYMSVRAVPGQPETVFEALPLNRPRPCCGSDHTGPEHGADCALPHESELDAMLAYLATELLGWRHRRYRPVGFTSSWWWQKPSKGFGDLEDLLTGNGMHEILEAMEARRLPVMLNCGAVSFGNAMSFGYLGSSGRSIPEAVARAAYAALQEGGS